MLCWAIAATLVASCGMSACNRISSAQFGQPDIAHQSVNSSPTRASKEAWPVTTYLPNTWTGIHAFQPFDNFDNKNVLTPAQAVSSATRYDAIWGSNSGRMVQAWRTRDRSIRTGYYFLLPADALTDQFGNLGHGLKWWKSHHPDWILYECDRKTVAYIQKLPEIPLDISNPAVISYVLQLTGAYAERYGYSALSVDFVELNNPTGGAGQSERGCGVWSNDSSGRPRWIQKFSGNRVDPKYAAAVIGWLSSAHKYLHRLPRPLALWGNHSPAARPAGDPLEIALLENIDVVDDEAGFAKYGKYSDNSDFIDTLYWAKYLQSRGKGFLLSALFRDSVNDAQLEYSIATYLMSKEQAAALDVYRYGTYGTEAYHRAYTAPIGEPCTEAYGGPRYKGSGAYLYYREFTGGLAVVNTSPAATYAASLPPATYFDAVTGHAAANPLSVAPNSGLVLLRHEPCSQ